jgi:peroxiredoxin Q/BCP
MRNALLVIGLLLSCAFPTTPAAAELGEGDPAPLFTAKTQNGGEFSLESRRGKWTVLYFYPKAGTPGCTKQANAFRDSIESIRAEDAEVYGISTDDVADQAAFHTEQQLTFTLLADPEGTVTETYGAKMPLLTMSKRWTFIIDPTLTIRQVEHDVDPTMDAQRVAAEIARLKRAADTTQNR